MKKILSFVFALALALALAVPCFANSYELPALPDTYQNWIVLNSSDGTINAVGTNNEFYNENGYVTSTDINYYRLIDGEWTFRSHYDSNGYKAQYIIYDTAGKYADNSLVKFLNVPIKSKDWATVLEAFTKQISVASVVQVLVVGATAVVGLVFTWWGVRKLSAALFRAFRKGKVSI